jgi:hypothetical protein
MLLQLLQVKYAASIRLLYFASHTVIFLLLGISKCRIAYKTRLEIGSKAGCLAGQCFWVHYCLGVLEKRYLVCQPVLKYDLCKKKNTYQIKCIVKGDQIILKKLQISNLSELEIILLCAQLGRAPSPMSNS